MKGLSPQEFSASGRSEILAKANSIVYDLCVIGGGVTGCGIALDAASRGLKTILFEKGDFASGTSSKSTKLIHGGLRYLKQLEFKLVHESGTERAVVNRLAPHLVRPEKMLLPLIKGGTFGRLSTSVGLRIYDFLAEVEKEDRRKMLSAKETLLREPLLDKSRVVGGGYYAEYRTDDARLTIELVKKAAEFGAHTANYTRVIEFLYNSDQIGGVRILDELTGREIDIKAHQVISAAGPWVDEVRKINNSIGEKRLHLTKGVHIVVPLERFPLKQSVYFDSPDGRMIFTIPRGKIAYIGTTDTTYNGDKDRIVVTKEDRDYLLTAVNGLFPSINLSADDVISNWAGLRPLIHEKGKSPSELSRRDEIFEAQDGLISIAGGKLTGYRKMAEKVVNLVIRRGQFNHVRKNSYTHEISLCGDCISDSEAVDRYIEDVSDRVEQLGLDRYYGWYLVTTYGKQLEWILTSITEFPSENPAISLILSEASYALKNEMVMRLDDFYIRRTGRLFFDIESVKETRNEVIDYLAEKLLWNKNKVKEENERLDTLLIDAENYYDQELVNESSGQMV